jgi:hypothetical protein
MRSAQPILPVASDPRNLAALRADSENLFITTASC